MALASARRPQLPWASAGLCGKRKGPLGVQGPRSPGPGPGGPPGAAPHRPRPASPAPAASVARQDRPGPRGGISHMPGVPAATQPLLPHLQVQHRPSASGLPPAAALCPGWGRRAPPHRHWFWPAPAPGPGQGLAPAARKKAGGSRGSARGRAGPGLSSRGISHWNPSGSGQGRFGPRHPLPDRESQICRPPIAKLQPVFRVSASSAKTGHVLQEAQAILSHKEACLPSTHPPKLITLVPEPRRVPGAPFPSPTTPAKPQLSGSPRDTLKGWLAGGQVRSPALNPGSPLWSLLSPG